jgi:hypothetical protein
MTTVYTGDVGTEIILDCIEDITAATVMTIKVRKSNGVKTTWTATLEGTTQIKYVILTGDLDVVGDWTLQAYIEMTGWKGSGELVTLRVNRPI